MTTTCNKCIPFKSGGNNHILSLLLIKYSKDRLKCFMLSIHMIISRERIYHCEISTLDTFNIKEDNKEFTFEEYLLLKIHSSLPENDYFFMLRSLFIISLINDERVKLYIFGDHTKITTFSSKLNPKVNITLFLTKCEQIIESFKNNDIPLTDIGYYASNEWRDIGLFVT